MRERLGGTSVYLVGMMGCGKSTVGKLLSAALDYYFFDSDSLVGRRLAFPPAPTAQPTQHPVQSR